MSDNGRLSLSELEAKLVKLEAGKIWLAHYALLTRKALPISTLEGEEREAALARYSEGITGLFIALRNSEGRPDIPALDLEWLASVHDLDLETLPKCGQKGGDIQIEDWAKWIVEQYGPVPDFDTKVSSMETRMFAPPPHLHDILLVGHEGLDEYLSDLEEWSDEIQSNITPPEIEYDEQSVTLNSHGADWFCVELDYHLRRCRSARSNTDDLAIHMAMLERHMEKWRRIRTAASNSGGGRPKRPHTECIELAVKYGYETFDALLGFLDQIDHGIDFEIDYVNKKVVCFPDHYKEPYEVRFGAIRKGFNRARKS